jgi:hypothetical protein
MSDQTDDWLELERLARLTAAWCELVGDQELAQEYVALADRYRARASRGMAG